MATDDIKETIDRLQHLIYGYNYQVTYGIDDFDLCDTLDVLINKLKEMYSDSVPNETALILFSTKDFWEEVDFGLTYRGDHTSGLILTVEKESQLLIEQKKYKAFIETYVSGSTKIYNYSDSIGIPGYIVWWGYAFLLLNNDRPSLFIYASASD